MQDNFDDNVSNYKLSNDWEKISDEISPQPKKEIPQELASRWTFTNLFGAKLKFNH